MSNHDTYVSPLSERYASREMQYIFSPDMKFKTWRRLSYPPSVCYKFYI